MGYRVASNPFDIKEGYYFYQSLRISDTYHKQQDNHDARANIHGDKNTPAPVRYIRKNTHKNLQAN